MLNAATPDTGSPMVKTALFCVTAGSPVVRDESSIILTMNVRSPFVFGSRLVTFSLAIKILVPRYADPKDRTRSVYRDSDLIAEPARFISVKARPAKTSPETPTIWVAVSSKRPPSLLIPFTAVYGFSESAKSFMYLDIVPGKNLLNRT